MTGWTISIFYLLTTAVLILFVAAGAIVLAVCLVKKKRLKVPVIFTASCLGALIAFGAFIGSHSTYFRFNDWSIKDGNVSEVVKKYGEPDIWYSEETGLHINVKFQNGDAVKKEPSEIWQFNTGKSGKVGYYIYTDNGPIMHDGLPHYYYIKYDGQGTVTEVYDGAHPGG